MRQACLPPSLRVLFVLFLVAGLPVSATRAFGQEAGRDRRDPVTVQGAVIKSSDSVRIFAPTSGMIAQQMVQVGDIVKAGQILAKLDAIELEAQLKIDRAALDRARAEVHRAKAGLNVVAATLDAMKADAGQAEAAIAAAEATTRLRDAEFKRLEQLDRSGAVSKQNVDEGKRALEMARLAEQAAKAAAVSAKANHASTAAKTELAKADLLIAEAGLVLAQAHVERAQVRLHHAALRAPVDGVVSQRGFAVGEFVRSAENRGNDPPLYTIERVDLLRVVIDVPEREAFAIEIGAPVEIALDALRDKKFSAKIARVAPVIDPKARTVRIELDLPNPTGQIRPGMAGNAILSLQKKKP